MALTSRSPYVIYAISSEPHKRMRNDLASVLRDEPSPVGGI